jgi:hypothetical protein
VVLNSQAAIWRCLFEQLHETLNLYVSPTAYIFEPASSSLSHSLDGASSLNEKDIRESLYVDRRTGRMALNGMHVGVIELIGAESADIPFGREKVITCYGIIGILSLATSNLHHMGSYSKS